MGMMGLPIMHHTTWDNLVSWVGNHVEKLADWSCNQVRADIEKRGDKTQWTASFDGFYLTILTIHLPLYIMLSLTALPGLPIVQNMAKVPTRRVHHLVQKEICWMNCYVRLSLRNIL